LSKFDEHFHRDFSLAVLNAAHRWLVNEPIARGQTIQDPFVFRGGHWPPVQPAAVNGLSNLEPAGSAHLYKRTVS
jgi:hypothetical protein